MIENELKVMLSTEEYNAILNIPIKSVKTATQINYYYDTPDFIMTDSRITYRIRKKNGLYVATIKTHLGNDSFKSDEHETFLGETFDDKCFTDMGLMLFGCITTERTSIICFDGVEVMLDKNVYLGHTDYEMEIEYQNNCDEKAMLIITDISELLHKQNVKTNVTEFIDRIYTSKNKSQRFFERLRNKE